MLFSGLLFLSFGDLGVLLFYFIDFVDVDEGDVLLPVDFL